MIGLLIAFPVLIIGGLVLVIVLARIDWRGIFERHWGNDYRRGRACFINAGVRSYLEAVLWYEGSFSMSYWTSEKIPGRKKPVIRDWIVPNPPAGAPMQFDSDGARLFWPIKGSVICTNSEKQEYQFTNYGPELMSSDMFDRVGVDYGKSVKEAQKTNFGMALILVIAGAVLLIVGGIFATKWMMPARIPPADNVSNNITIPGALPPGAVYGVPVTPDQGGE